jgi:hypothetical protein
MRFLRTHRIARSLSLLLALAFLSTAVVGCGGSGGGSVPGDQHQSAGTVNVINNTGLFFATLTLTATNGSVTATNVPIGGSSEFTNVGVGAFSVNAYGAAGQHLAGTSGTMTLQGNLTVALN